MQDKIILGTSHLVPYRPGEGFRSRHRRRLMTNFKKLPVLARFCESSGITVKIQGEGQQWSFVKNRDRIDWWPSTAKLVVNQDWHNGVHCHDFWQCIEMLKKHLMKTR